MVRALGAACGVAVVSALVAGCPSGVVVPNETDTTALSVVSLKAVEVADRVGGEDGYGGALMAGYSEHMPPQIGFDSAADLASSSDMMTVRLSNQSETDGTFHLSYFASHMGFDEVAQDVDVVAGDVVAVELPCPEMVGLGPLGEPGEPGCHLATGEAVANTMVVPGFLGQDFVCGGEYECTLVADTDDLDGDGDTAELIIVSGAFDFHMTNGGPTGHAHGTGAGMMGSHMGM